MLTQIARLFIQALDVYSFLLFAWAIGSWFPRLQHSKIYSYIDLLVSPFVGIFRNLIPPLGGFDLSVIFCLFTIHLLKSILYSLGF